ncbi:phosphoribosylaminoimidazolesuccinocarboxamide synthase [candidate division CSSED10-310 bacterium]|uniref:Phosphoribosylaminoimidazole-succinocarboxamide synthase n=1 Tax=candidate division CSSED10-310 bacterium TaxID=2855610 RepID=A0ABV6YUQ7_UNCC1
MNSEPLLHCELTAIPLHKRGKVRDIYSLEQGLLFIATDRISAFDAVLPNGIPDKGKVLCSLSVFWFNLTKHIIENHLITADVEKMPLPQAVDLENLRGRTIFVKSVKPIPFECIVRGYLAGSAWREYQHQGSICGIKLEPGLKIAAQLPEPIFTPATKSEQGHDINIPFSQMCQELGSDLAEQMRSISLELFNFASKYSRERNLILTDTKFEFGLEDNKLILIDEIFTPDSSRFWQQDTYEPGVPQEGLDKEFVRDYLRRVNWTGDGPPPKLPDDIVTKTRSRYLEVFQLMTGQKLF